MNYPEELRIRYNEVMFDERDIIEKFLKDQYDLCYGYQCNTWHFEPAIEMMAYQGSTVKLTDIVLNEDSVVDFIVDAYPEKGVIWECTDFAYGELSKVIEALPDTNQILIKNAVSDIARYCSDCSVSIENSPFNTNINGKSVSVALVDYIDGRVVAYNHDGEVVSDEYASDFLVGLRNHIYIEVLHRSEEYKKLVEFLSKQPNLYFEPAYCCHDTNVKVDVLSASLDSNGKLQLCVDDDEKRTIYLEEKDIRPEYLVELVGYIEDHCYCDIIDTSYGHNAELVRKINNAWKYPEYRHRMAFIVYSIAQRDYPECEKKFNCDMGDFLALIIDDCDFESIHKVLQEICDDIDLQTILLFIRYK